MTHDLVGLFDKHVPRFVKSYANLAPQIKDAVAAFRDEVKTGAFPAPEHAFSMQIEVKDLLDSN